MKATERCSCGASISIEAEFISKALETWRSEHRHVEQPAVNIPSVWSEGVTLPPSPPWTVTAFTPLHDRLSPQDRSHINEAAVRGEAVSTAEGALP